MTRERRFAKSSLLTILSRAAVFFAILSRAAGTLYPVRGGVGTKRVRACPLSRARLSWAPIVSVWRRDAGAGSSQRNKKIERARLGRLDLRVYPIKRTRAQEYDLPLLSADDNRLNHFLSAHIHSLGNMISGQITENLMLIRRRKVLRCTWLKQLKTTD